jgi:hypothetical protein
MTAPLYSAEFRPRLVVGVREAATNVRLGEHIEVTGPSMQMSTLVATLGKMDGSATLCELASGGMGEGELVSLVADLDAAGVIDDLHMPPFRSGLEVFLELEDLIDAYCAETIFRNPFWETCAAARAPGDLPENLATGMVIENWHFLFRESYFDAPVLSYVANTQIRLLLNQFFSEEYGHDEILLRTLNFVGFSREDMLDAIPLPQTMALCNALAYWSHTDPLFFFATLGLLEGQGGKHDSFIKACDRCRFPAEFVAPLRAHANINLNAAHGSLSRSVFAHVAAIDAATEKRLKAQARLFVELYDAFYWAIFKYYTSGQPILRRVAHL